MALRWFAGRTSAALVYDPNTGLPAVNDTGTVWLDEQRTTPATGLVDSNEAPVSSLVADSYGYVQLFGIDADPVVEKVWLDFTSGLGPMVSIECNDRAAFSKSTDADTAEWVTDGPLTKAALDAEYATVATIGDVDTRLRPSATADPTSIVVANPSGILEGRVLTQYGSSRGATGNATRISWDRLRGRINPAIFANNSVAGWLCPDMASFAYGGMAAVRQGSAADASLAAAGIGTWTNRAMWAALVLLWPFANDALIDGATTHNNTTAKARASAANALHALICLLRAEQRIESALTVSITTTSGSATVTGPGSPFYRGALIANAAGVPANTYVGTILSPTSFKLSSSRTSQVDVTATASATYAAAILSSTFTGTWSTPASTAYSGGTAALTTANGATTTRVLWLDEPRRVQQVLIGVDDAEYTALGGAGGSDYSITVDGGTAITGTLSDQHRITNISGGQQLGLGFGQLAVDLGTLSAGQHTIVITNTGTTGKRLVDDVLLVESLTPLTIPIMKEVELPALYYSQLAAYNVSYAKTQIYNTIIDTEVAKWPADDSVFSIAIDSNGVNGTYDKAVHISSIDGAWIHFNDAGERLVTDKIMGVLNKLGERAGFTRI